MKMEHTAVQDTKRSSPSLKGIGSAPQRSGQDAAHPLTPTELLSHPEPQVRAIVAMLLGLMAEGMSQDHLFLAMNGPARQIAIAAGVSQEDWEEALETMASLWSARKKNHPYGDLIMFT
jgi:hypothetical protein